MDETKITTGPGDEAPRPERSDPSNKPPRDPYDEEPPRRRDWGRTYEQDRQYLNLLVIFHFVLAGLTFFAGLCPLGYVGFGIFMVSGAFPMPPNAQGPGPSPEMLGWIIIGEFGFFFVMLYGSGILAALVGAYLKQRKRWLFCIVCSGIQCLFMPFGTVLGIFTIIVLVRESVKDVFKYGEFPFGDEDYT